MNPSAATRTFAGFHAAVSLPIRIFDLTHPHSQRVASPVIDTDYNGKLFRPARVFPWR